MLAASLARTDSPVPARAVESSTAASTSLLSTLLLKPTPTETPIPTKPAPISSVSPPLSAVMLLASLASISITPLACTVALFRTEATTVLAIAFSDLAPNPPAPTPT